MSDTKDLKLNFTGIAVHGPELAVVTSVRGDVPDDADVNHELVYIHERGEWTVYDAKDKNIVGATFDASGDEIALLSPDGFVRRLLSNSTLHEEIDASDDGPSALVQVRQMRRWPGVEVVVGMARRVYARSAGQSGWQPIDQACFVPRGQRSSAIGFNGVDGWSADELVAVGYKGEVWFRSRQAWAQADSPTNATLTAVACADSPRSFVAVGLAGVVMIGTAVGARLVDQGAASGAFWSVVHFNGSFFIAGDEGVFRLDGPAYDALVPVPLTARGNPSTAYLAAGGGVLWSVGERDIFSSTDGVKWKRVPSP